MCVFCFERTKKENQFIPVFVSTLLLTISDMVMSSSRANCTRSLQREVIDERQADRQITDGHTDSPSRRQLPVE